MSRPLKLIAFLISMLFLISACKTGEISGGGGVVAQNTYAFDQSSFFDIDLTPGINSGTITVVKFNEPISVNYTIFVPEHIGTDTVPLVFGLHGRGQPSSHLVGSYLTPALGDLRGIIFGFDAPENSDWLDAPSVRMVKKIIDLAIENWPIDKNKIVLTGYSMGGTGTWNIMTKYPDLFAAAIPVASTPQPWVKVPSAKVPLYVIHGQYDDFFLLRDIETAVAELRERNAKVELVVIPDTTHQEISKTLPYLYETIDWLQTTVWPE
jgi:predicted peptidase